MTEKAEMRFKCILAFLCEIKDAILFFVQRKEYA